MTTFIIIALCSVLYLAGVALTFKLMCHIFYIKTLDDFYKEDTFSQCGHCLISVIAAPILLPVAIIMVPAYGIGILMRKILPRLFLKNPAPPELPPYITYGEAISYRHPPLGRE